MAIKREYPLQPVVGVAGIVIRDERVLLVQRGESRMQGRWSIPGGCLELGETVQQGVERELREETCLEVRCVALVDAVDAIDKDESGRIRFDFVILNYLCKWLTGEAVTSSDAADHAWVLESELANYQVDAVAAEVTRKAFRMHGDLMGR
jgi:ADP-ribose pyrophosphatase YjhB (NUDIX family)